MRDRLLPAAVLFAFVLIAVSVCLLILGSASADYRTIDQVAIDVDVAGNTPTSLGHPDGCVTATVGQDIQFDIVAWAIPGPDNGGNGAAGYNVFLNYNPAVLNITAVEAPILGADVLIYGDPLPNSGGSFYMDVYDPSLRFGKTGDGVLFRITAHAVGIGSSALTVHGPGYQPVIYDPYGEAYDILDVFGGLIVVGADCPALTPTPTQRFGAISGKVLDLHGDPIAGATVGSFGTSYGSTTTDVLGNYLLENVATGLVGAAASAPGYQSFYWTSTGGAKTNGEPITVLGAQTTTGIDFRLGTLTIVTGRVVDGQGQPLTGVHVHAFSPSGGGEGSALTNDDGRYSITDMRDSRVLFFAFLDGRESAFWSETGLVHEQSDATYAVIDNGTDQRIDNIDFALRKLPKVTGHVLDAQGNPVEGAYVLLNGCSSCGGNSGGVYTQADGFFDLGYVSPERDYPPMVVRQGFFTSFWTPTGGTVIPFPLAYVSFTYEQDFNSLDFRLVRPGSISGRITDSSGNPISQPQIQFWPPNPCYHCSINPPDGNGYFRFTVEPGDYKLHLNANPPFISVYWAPPGGDFRSGEFIHVADGADVQNIDIVVPRAAYIDGYVRLRSGDAVANASVELFDGSCSDVCGRAFTYSTGHFAAFTYPGSYKLRVWKPGYLTSYYTEGGTTIDPSQASLITVAEGGFMSLGEVTLFPAACAYDQNGDLVVDRGDLLVVLRAMGSQPDSKRWKPSADLNSDAHVTGRDLHTVMEVINSGACS